MAPHITPAPRVARPDRIIIEHSVPKTQRRTAPVASMLECEPRAPARPESKSPRAARSAQHEHRVRGDRARPAREGGIRPKNPSTEAPAAPISDAR
jgi:hypothetical protein